MCPIRRAMGALFVTAGLLTAGAAMAQGAPPDLSPSCDFAFGMCGYVDGDDRTVIEPRFEHADRFRMGLAAVKIDGLYGFIDTSGSVVIPARFDLVGDFYAGHAAALMGAETGAIDTRGNWIVAPSFAQVIPFTRDVLLVQEGESPRPHLAGRERLGSPASRATGPYGGGRWGLFHASGHWVLEPDLYDLNYFETEGRGLIWAKSQADGSRLWGLMGADGIWIAEPQYSGVSRLYSGRATVAVPRPVDAQSERQRGRRETWRWGAVDDVGHVVIPIAYERLYPFNFDDELTRFRLGGKAGFMDRSGAIVIPAIYDEASQDHRGRPYVVIHGKRVGIDREGNVVAHPQDGEVYRTCPSGLSLINRQGDLQIAGPDGRPIIDTLFDISLLGWFRCDRPSAVRIGGKWSFIDTDGRLMFDPPPFETQHGFHRGVAAVSLNGKWGLIDERGQFIVEPTFDTLRRDESSHRRLFRAEIDGRETWINENGKETTPQEWLDRQARFSCGHGVHIVRQDGKWGMTDPSGATVIAPQFDALTCYRAGLAWAAYPHRREWCLIDLKGQISPRHQCQCDQPLIIFEHAGGSPTREDCYADGLAEAWDFHRATADR